MKIYRNRLPVSKEMMSLQVLTFDEEEELWREILLFALIYNSLPLHLSMM